MNKSRINDFVNIWAEVVGLTGEENKKYVNLIKTDIFRRCAMYEQDFPTISIKDDDCAAYIIKPVNNEYNFEDFLLNRLMLGLRDVSFTGALEGNAGDYIAYSKSLNIDTNSIASLVKDKSTRHSGLQGKCEAVIGKTIEHELGHCYKSKFNDGFKAPLGYSREQDEVYKKLIEALSTFENGKYASQIKSMQEFNLEGDSKPIKTGVHNAKVAYQSQGISDYRIQWIDELLNESEALELVNSNEVQEIWHLQDENGRGSSSGNYVNVYNYISRYSTFTGYGPILKSLLGKEGCFKAEYMSSAVDIFKQFDQEYADIVKDVWDLDPEQYPPMKCLFLDFDCLRGKSFFNEKIMLKLDEFLAKCYERKIEKVMNQSNGVLTQEQIEATLKEMEIFQSRLTTNKDPKKRDALAHNVIFNNLRTRIQERTIQHEQPLSESQVEMSEGYSINEFGEIIRPARDEYKVSNKTEIKQIRSIEITELLNQDLLRKKIQLPNGAEIMAKQYIQEVVAPHIPSSGKFMLKSGAEISARQFIEEAILASNNAQIRGNITELLENYTKVNNGLINFRGEQINPVDIVGSLNPTLMSQKVKLPNGAEISARQYIQEVVAPHIPSSGKFMLKNGVELPASQFIEEVLLGQIGDYKGDVRALLDGTTKANNGIIDIEEKKKFPRGQELRQEIGISQAEAQKKKEEQQREGNEEEKQSKKRQATIDKANAQKPKRLPFESLESDIAESMLKDQISVDEVNDSQRDVKDKIEMQKLRFMGKNLTAEQQKRLTQLEQIYQTNQRQAKKQQGQGMGR